jgi:imidazolonepropionase-like amidohydrolase
MPDSFARVQTARMERIEADLLIPGRGAVIEGGCVVLDDATITYAGPAGSAPATPGATTTRVPVVMPGMWDCHGHFMGVMTGDISQIVHLPPEVAAARAAADARAALMAGFTSVREAGGLGVHLARVIDEGTLLGPTIYAPGAILSTTGGHGDIHGFPLEWITEYGHRGGSLYLCDGVAECLRGVRAQLRLNAKVIKVCASGGVLSEVDDPIHQQFSDEELAAIVAEAARADRIVMAHCHGKPGIMAALRAGCHTIEHGTYLDEEAAALMASKGAVLVPTRYIIERMVEVGADTGVPDYAMRKINVIADIHAGSIAIARDAGVTIACGTDIATTGPDTLVPWGTNGREPGALVEAGLPPLEAIAAATANAPQTLGPQAPRAGLLSEGYDADVIALTADPVDDIAVLADPANVAAVWKRGVAVKNTLN